MSATSEAMPGSAAREIAYRSCNFCGGTRFERAIRLPVPFPREIYGDRALSFPSVGEKLHLQYLRCLDCGLMCINPLTHFADIDVRRFDGERNIVAWTTVNYEEYARGKENVIRIVYEQYGLERFRRTNRVLDVSCGPGVALDWLQREKGWAPFGVDPDLHSVRTARERYGLEIEQGLIQDVSAPDEHFDLLIMDNALEHTFDPLGTLLAAFRLLRKGGGFFIFVPNPDGLSTRFLHQNAHWGHWFFYPTRVLYRTLRQIGFRVPRLVAIQNPINPELEARGIDLEPYRACLAVTMSGEKDVARRVEEVVCCSDFYNLLAVKPDDAGIRSDREGELARIAAASRLERDCVEIVQR